MIGRALTGLIGWVVGFLTGVANFFVSQWSQYNPLGQFLFVLALTAIANDAAISYKYGASSTINHAVGFMVVTLAFCILPDVALTERKKGNKGNARTVWIACIPLGIVCLWSHVGYSSGVRLGDIQQDGFRHAAYESATTALKDKRKTLEMKQEQLKTAQAKSAAALERNKGWVVSVDPISMQSSLDALDTKIANEAKRVRCGQKCEDLKVERGQLAAMISNAKNENDLAGQITTLESEIEEKAKEVAAMAPQGSVFVHQSNMAAKLFNTVAWAFGHADAKAILEPTAFQRDMANTMASGAGSIAFMIVGAILMTAAGMNRKMESLGHAPTDTGKPVAFEPPTTKANDNAVLAPAPSVPASNVPPTFGGLEEVKARRARAAALAMRQSRFDGALLATA